MFASNQGEKHNFNQILQRMTNTDKDQEPQHPKFTHPPLDFVVKIFLETLTNDENVDTLSQSIKEAAQYGNLDIFELLYNESSLVQGISSFRGLSFRECRESTHVSCKYHTSRITQES